MPGILQALVIGLGAILAVVVVVVAVVYLIVPTFKGIGWLFKQVFTFIGGMLTDTLRAVGTILMVLILTPLAIGSIIFGRWSATAHFGRAIQNEFKTAGACLYRIGIGHPARLLCLTPLLDGVERRLPEVVAAAPGRDKPRGKVGQFDGYRIVGSLPTGGSGSKLYIAEPDEVKAAVFERMGHAGVGKVVIKSFSIHDGSSLPQIVRESRSLDAAKKLGLVLDHDLTPDRFYYAMRYVPGESLTTVTQQLHAQSGVNGLDDKHLGQSLGFVADLVRTLDGYHKGGLWHKDVKPDNIIVDGPHAHLVDFGLLSSLRSAMTLTTHGTEYFRDPEMVRMALKGVKVHEVDGAKFDIFAAGAVMFSVVENSFPAHGALSQITRRCPDSVRWIVRRAMTDYDKRYASAAEMLADIEFVRQAPDAFAVKPAELPSMRGGGVQIPGPESFIPPIPNRAGVTHAGDFESVWSRIVAHAGQRFETKNGFEFSYATDGNSVLPNRTQEHLHKSEFAKVWSMFPVPNPGRISNLVRGSSYIWAILHDPRIATHAAGVAQAVPVGAPLHADPVQRKRPRLRVTDWWTGKYAVDPQVAAARPFAVNPGFVPPAPAAVGAPVAGPGYAVPIGGIGRVDAASFAPAQPVPIPNVGGFARTPRVDPAHRRPAKEQLERAQARAKAAQDRAHARMKGRLSARRAGGGNPTGMNLGTGFAAGVAVLVGVGAIIAASRQGRVTINGASVDGATIFNDAGESVRVAASDAADQISEGTHEVADAVRGGVADALKRLGVEPADRPEVQTPAPDGPARLMSAVGAVPGSESGTILFVSDVVVLGSQPYVRQYIDTMEASSEALRRMGYTVLGDAAHVSTLDSDEFGRQVELISQARRAVGATPKGTERMIDAVMDFEAGSGAVDAVVWIWPDTPNNPTQFSIAVVGPGGAELHSTDAGHFDQALVSAVKGAFERSE